MTAEQKRFIELEIINWSITAGLSRGKNVYKKGIEEKKRELLKVFLKKELPRRFSNSYSVDSDTHVNELRRFKRDIDGAFSILLNKQGIYFGRVQKIVNLYLKYRWACFNDPKPIHCPFDRIVIHEGLGLKDISWTSMTEDQYIKHVLLKVEKVAGGFEKIADWEITFFNQINKAY